MGSDRRTGVLLCGEPVGCSLLVLVPRLFQARVDENQEGLEPTWQVVAKRIAQGQLSSPSAEASSALHEHGNLLHAAFQRISLGFPLASSVCIVRPQHILSKGLDIQYSFPLLPDRLRP